MPTGSSWTSFASLALVAASVLGLGGTEAVPTDDRLAVAPVTASAEVAPKVAPVKVSAPRCAKAQPRTAKQWQATFTALHGQWEGADVASTVALPDGRTLWLFGDTLHRTAAGMGVRHNSMLMGERGCLTPVAGPGGAEPIPTRADGQWFWPTHGVVEGGRLYVFATSVAKTGRGSMDFKSTGMNIAEFDLPKGGDPVFRTVHSTPASDTTEARPQWGAAVVQQGGYTYVYGTQKVHRALIFGRNVYVARVPIGHLTDASQWRYWTGKSWSRKATGAAVVIDAQKGMPTSFSVHAGPGGSVTAIAKKDDYLGQSVIAMSAPSPAGRWGSAQYGVHSHSDPTSGKVTYLALGHPELRLASGGLLVSVSRNNLNPKIVEAHPQQYRPKFYEVEVR